MFSTQMAKSIHKRFYELRDDWKAKTRHLSNTAQISLVFCKAITPYSEPILDDVKLPLTRQEVRNESDSASPRKVAEMPFTAMSTSMKTASCDFAIQIRRITWRLSNSRGTAWPPASRAESNRIR